MAKKKALITGIAGQDGSYLAEYLLGLGYEVHGIVRSISFENKVNTLWRLENILDKITLHGASLESYPSIFKIFHTVAPDECYHLAAQSFVSYSLEDQFPTMNSNIEGIHYVLSSLANASPQCKFYFAGTSELFGLAQSSPQDESTAFRPRSIYGLSKLVGYHLTSNYRENHKIFACTGILFNHESPRRAAEFVTRKITSAAAKIKLGLCSELQMGNIDAQRDWGFAGDYVKAMHLMLQQSDPQDYVIGTGVLHSVREFLDLAFSELDLDYKKYIKIDQTIYRKSEEIPLLANTSKTKKYLKWEPEVNFEKLVKLMVKADYEHLKQKI